MKSKYLTDYLPIKNPLENKSDIDFYENIVKYLIEDVVKLANTGIPIDLEKIQKLDKLLEDTIKEHTNKLLNNRIVKYFSNAKIKRITQDKIKASIKPLDKSKLATELNLKRNRDINILIDVIIDELIENGKLKDNFRRINEQEIWSIKKLKNIYLLTNSLAICKIIDRDYDNIVLNHYKSKANKRLYEKNLDKEEKKLKNKIEKITTDSQQFIFNPKSSTQIKELFNYIGLESRFKTEKGLDSFNKLALAELLEIVNNKLKEE